MSVALKREHAATSPGRFIAWLVIIALIVAVVVWALTRARPTDTTVARRDIVATTPVAAVAVAPASASAAIYAPYQAPVSRVYAAVGQTVHQGDVIAELAQPAARTAYEQARLNVQTAESNLKTVGSRYDATIASAREQVKAAEIAVKQAQASSAAASTTNTTTTTSTAPTTTVTAPQPQTSANLSAAQAQLATAEQRLATIKATRDQALAPYQQQLTAAQATLKEAQAGVKAGLMRAPISGTVTSINLQAGALPPDASKTPAATVVALDKLQIQGTVKGKDGDAIRVGMPVDATFDGLAGEHFTGKVARIDPNQGVIGSSYTVTCDFDNHQGLVKPGTKALVNIILGQAKNVIAVPNNAIIKDRDGNTAVKVPTGRAMQTVPVTTGLSDGRYTEIRSGLTDGQRVQVQPSLL